MGAGAPAVARLERTLAQGKSPSFVLCLLRSKQIVVVADHRAAEWPASMFVLATAHQCYATGPFFVKSTTRPEMEAASSRHAEKDADRSVLACVS